MEPSRCWKHWDRFIFGVEIFAKVTYNMLNKAADTIADTYPFPAQ